ncbi:PepSY domain-containing protein [Dongia sp.]|uniref:PepSY domain-containing protein n=1 Tax=Dongia sp. TaxID=1977262 RepID=UPI0035AE12C6
MKKFALSLILLTTLGAGAASAAELCQVPEAEWQPKEALEQKLQADGWTIKKVKIDEGCYEVYGTNAKGEKQEVYFNPKTFDVVKAD